MPTLSDLIAQREKLLRMRAAGTASVRDGDRSVAFRSDAELAAAIAALDGEIAALEGRPPVRQIRIWADKGL
ncbi:phage head-tail joining protein [Elioraea sp.]|uniref:phage head-tail joining protein n=1 Tax=Elioraea sp. TaxID=2185103 RepID=UPI003F7223F2